MRDSRYYPPNRQRTTRTTLAVLAAIAFVVLVLWAIIGWWLDAEWSLLQWFHWSLWRQYFATNGWNPFGATPLGFLGIGAALCGIGYVIGVFFPAKFGAIRTAQWIVAGLTVLAFIVTTFTNIAAGSASYSTETITVVKDTENVPSSLRQLVNSSERSNGECTYVGNNADVPSCITEDNFQLSWEPRVSSAQGARIVLQRASESDNLSEVMDDTLAYLQYAKGGKWSAIRDGRKAQPIVSVLEWDGVGKVESCKFDDDYELNMAFAGRFGKNLANEIARQFPNNLYEDVDMWGYCKGESSVKEPVIVIPTRVREGFEHVTTDRFGGLLVITGSPSGKPMMTLDKEIKPGEYLGPVYPSTLAALQRKGFEYSAGIINNWFRGFGYATLADVASQADNPSEYLLTSTVDKRRYWVTPLRPGSTKSQQVVAYSVVPADEATVGKNNIHRLYVMNPDDRAVVDMQRLYNRVVDAVNQRQPAFFTGDDDSKGKLLELLPTEEGVWQIYAERGGNVVYKVEIDQDDRIQPKVESLSAATVPPTGGAGQPATGVTGCDAPEKLTPEQIRQCVDKLVTELGTRANKQ